MDKNEFQSYKENYRLELLDIKKYYSNSNKKERELWVAREYLNNLGISFQEKELTSSKEEPPDIIYNDAKFEIKELMDIDRKRYKEINNELEKLEKIKDIKELRDYYTPKNLTFQMIIDITIEKLKTYDKKYDLATKNNLDILFYFNLDDYHLKKEGKYTLPKEISEYGWRSISLTRYDLSSVLFASNSAPEFIKANEGKFI